MPVLIVIAKNMPTNRFTGYSNGLRARINFKTLSDYYISPIPIYINRRNMEICFRVVNDSVSPGRHASENGSGRPFVAISR